jgi:hypothetical protein
VYLVHRQEVAINQSIASRVRVRGAPDGELRENLSFHHHDMRKGAFLEAIEY